MRANCIAPGLIRTDFARALWENPETLKRSTAGAPLRRIGEPDEIAGAAVFLASKAGSFTTGQTIVCDGGATISHSVCLGRTSGVALRGAPLVRRSDRAMTPTSFLSAAPIG